MRRGLNTFIPNFRDDLELLELFLFMIDLVGFSAYAFWFLWSMTQVHAIVEQVKAGLFQLPMVSLNDLHESNNFMNLF